jgi:WD40 repeat protein
MAFINTKYHQILAEYFSNKPLYLDAEQKQPNTSKLVELPWQQTKAEMWDEVVVTLCDLLFVEAKCANGMTFPLVEDYRYTHQHLPDAQPEIEEERRRKARANKWTEDLIEYSRQWTNRRKKIACKETIMETEPKFPDVIPTVRMWTNEEIEIDAKRSIEHPTRLDKFKMFQNFVNAEAYPLTNFGKIAGFVVQHAFNSAPAGSVFEAARKVLPLVQSPIILHQWKSNDIYIPRQALLKTLEGHTDEVTSVNITSDGLRAISSSRDGTLRLWNLDSGQCILKMGGERSWSILSASLLPNLTRAFSINMDNTLNVWDLQSGHRFLSMTPRSGRDSWFNLGRQHPLYDPFSSRFTQKVNSISVTPDGSRAITGNWASIGGLDPETGLWKQKMYGTLRLWDIETGQRLRTLASRTEQVSCVSISPDGSKSICSNSDGTLRIWDLESGVCSQTFEGHKGLVRSISVTPNWAKVVSGGDDKTIRVWDIKSGQCLLTLEGHSEEVTSVSITPDGTRAISGGEENIVRIWDLESGQCLRTLEGHFDFVYGVGITPDGTKAISGGDDKGIRVWDIESGTCMRKSHSQNGEVSLIRITPDGKKSISGGSDGTLSVWNLKSGLCLNILVGHTEYINDIAFTTDGFRAISGGLDKTLRIWDIESGLCIRSLEGHREMINKVKISLDGTKVISASWDKTLRVWDIETGKCLHVLQGHQNVPIKILDITPDGKKIISGDDHNHLRIWEIESGQCLFALEEPGLRIVSISPDGKKAITGTHQADLNIWDLESGSCVRTVEGHRQLLEVVSFTPDGLRAISGGYKPSLCVWDIETGLCLHTLTGHRDSVYRVLLTPDVQRIISCSEDDTIRIWDLSSGQCLHSLKFDEDQANNRNGTNTVLGRREIDSIFVTPDGSKLISTFDHKTLRIWDIESGQCCCCLYATQRFSAVAFSLSELTICTGTQYGDVNFFVANNLTSSPPSKEKNIVQEEYTKLIQRGLQYSRTHKGEQHEDTIAHRKALVYHLRVKGREEEARLMENDLERYSRTVS